MIVATNTGILIQTTIFSEPSSSVCLCLNPTRAQSHGQKQQIQPKLTWRCNAKKHPVWVYLWFCRNVPSWSLFWRLGSNSSSWFIRLNHSGGDRRSQVVSTFNATSSKNWWKANSSPRAAPFCRDVACFRVGGAERTAAQDNQIFLFYSVHYKTTPWLKFGSLRIAETLSHWACSGTPRGQTTLTVFVLIKEHFTKTQQVGF